jgi:hypothetical protein
MGAGILIPILAEIGAPILKKILADRLPGTEAVSDAVVDTIAKKIGVDPTPEAIKDAYDKAPEVVTAAVKVTETENGAELLAEARKAAEIFKREDAKGGFWSAWRPAMSWLVLFLWLWNAVLIGLVNAALGSKIAVVPYDMLVTFSSLWLIVYGGGHTAKSIFGTKLGGK